MKKNKHSLKISRSYFGETTLDGYPIATYSNDELNILKNLLEKVLCEVNGYDISKITGAIPQNIGEGFQFNLSGKTYTTMGSYTKDKKRLMNIEISSFCGLCGGAIHYYAKLYINVSNVCGNSSVSGYLGGIEIPNEYQTIKGEFVRPLTQKEIDKQPKRWGNWYQVGDLVNAFESLEEIENLIKKLKKKFSSKEWKVEIRRNY